MMSRESEIVVDYPQFLEVERVLRQLWPKGDHRPVDGAAAQRYYAFRYPVLARYDFEDVVSALYALASKQKWEPQLAEICEVVEGRRGGWSDGWERLVAAVNVVRNEKPPVYHFEEVAGSDAVVRVFDEPPQPNKWREVAGEDVAHLVDTLGGIRHVMDKLSDSTFRAQFRDLWKERSEAPPTLDDGRKALESFRQLAELTSGSAELQSG